MADAGSGEGVDIATGKLAITAVAVVAVLLLVLAGMYGLYAWFDRAGGAPMPGTTRSSRAADVSPRLETRPGHDLQQLRAGKQAILESYGWVDRKAGIVRIPVERAAQLLVQRHSQAPGGSP